MTLVFLFWQSSLLSGKALDHRCLIIRFLALCLSQPVSGEQMFECLGTLRAEELSTLVSLLVSDEVHRVVKDPSAGVTLEATSLVNLFVLTQASR